MSSRAQPATPSRENAGGLPDRGHPAPGLDGPVPIQHHPDPLAPASRDQELNRSIELVDEIEQRLDNVEQLLNINVTQGSPALLSLVSYGSTDDEDSDDDDYEDILDLTSVEEAKTGRRPGLLPGPPPTPSHAAV